MQRSGEEMCLGLTNDARRLFAGVESHEAESRLGYRSAYSREVAEAVLTHAEAYLRLLDKYFSYIVSVGDNDD